MKFTKAEIDAVIAASPRTTAPLNKLVLSADHQVRPGGTTSKMSIALKEANETGYWLSLLKDSSYLEAPEYDSIAPDCRELIAMLVATVKTSKTT